MLSDDEVGAWLRSVNALRLVLGTRLDVQEDDTGEVDPGDPDADRARPLSLPVGPGRPDRDRALVHAVTGWVRSQDGAG